MTSRFNTQMSVRDPTIPAMRSRRFLHDLWTRQTRRKHMADSNYPANSPKAMAFSLSSSRLAR